MKKIKVLQVVGVNYKQGNGITTIVDQLVKTLNSQQIQSEVLLLKPNKLEVTYPLHVVPQNYTDFFKKQHYDLVIFHGLFYKEYIKIGKLLLDSGIPYLIKPHSSLMKNSHKKSYFKKKVAFILFFNRLIKNSYALVFSNEEERINSIFQKHRYYIEKNGLNIDQNVKITVNETREINLLFLSRLDFKHKGIDYLIAGYKKYLEIASPPIARLNIYGQGSDRQLKKLKKLIKNVPGIHFYGPAFGEEKEKVLQQNDILMLTSRFEGFPTIFIDVLIRGIPVIITPGTNATYFQNEGVAWVTDLNANAIASTIEKATKEFTKNKTSIAQACVDFAWKEFDICKNINQTISIYHEAITQKKQKITF